MKNKYETITTIIELFDEIERLSKQLEALQNQKKEVKPEEVIKPFEPNYFEKKLLEEGKKRILKDSIYSWEKIEVKKDESGNIKTTPYEKWVERKIGNIPDWLSKQDFLKLFADDLMAIYNKEKEEAIKKLESDKSEKE